MGTRNVQVREVAVVSVGIAFKSGRSWVNKVVENAEEREANCRAAHDRRIKELAGTARPTSYQPGKSLHVLCCKMSGFVDDETSVGPYFPGAQGFPDLFPISRVPLGAPAPEDRS